MLTGPGEALRNSGTAAPIAQRSAIGANASTVRSPKLSTTFVARRRTHIGADTDYLPTLQRLRQDMLRELGFNDSDRETFGESPSFVLAGRGNRVAARFEMREGGDPPTLPVVPPLGCTEEWVDGRSMIEVIGTGVDQFGLRRLWFVRRFCA